MPKKPSYEELEKRVRQLEELEFDRKKTERSLRESEQNFRILANLSQEAIVIHMNGQLKFANDQYFNMFGYTPHELTAVDIIEKTLTPDSAAFVKQNVRNKTPGAYEVTAVRKNGIEFPVEIHPYYISYRGQHVRAAVISDITDRKLAEQEKLHARKLAAEREKYALVGQVAGKMAHDFNNILAAIMGNAELTLLDSKETETIQSLELIFQQAVRGKNLTRNLVAFAKDQEIKQEFFKVTEKIDIVLGLLKKELNRVTVIKEEQADIPELLADPGMIEHAFVNLIQNSIHATSLSEKPKIIIRTYCRDDYICIEFEDNGCGIPSKYRERIYEPSFTLKGSRDVTGFYKNGIKGTGYGMANVKKYIEQHKGYIHVESKIESGTTFTIGFPVIRKELTPKEKADIKKGKVCFNKRILLVEDEKAVSDVQYKILTQAPCNHRVDIAHNGQTAKDLFIKNTYDFISLDYILPGDINGMGVYKFIRETNTTIPILFVSGNLEFLESIKDLKQKDPYIDHLSKPCPNKEYVNGINTLLEQTFPG